MRFSIITPSYNQVDFIEHTIRSVLGQDYSDLEYIIVDGGSTDGSVDVIRRYEDQLAWWVTEPDKGQADAINKGFQQATGEIVAWLNSDDMYAPGAIVHAFQVFKTDPEIGMVYGNAISFDQDGRPLNDLGIGDWALKDLVSFHILCQPAVFMRKTFLDQAGYLDDGYHMMLDHHLWLRLAQRTKIHHVPQVWAFARHHAEAKNVSQAPKFGQEAFKILDWMGTQPVLAAIIAENRRNVLARVYRFNGRYLLEGGLGWDALKSYTRSFFYQPIIALQEWHRIVYSILTILGLGKLGKLYYRVKKKRIPPSILEMGIENIHRIYLA
jgi:glycosyltransferase involved in cell wall biosynthesis